MTTLKKKSAFIPTFPVVSRLLYNVTLERGKNYEKN